LMRKGTPYVSLSEVEEEYNNIATLYSQTPRKHTQVYEYIMNMKRMGILETKPSGKGRRGRSLLIGIGGAPLEPVAKKINELLEKRL